MLAGERTRERQQLEPPQSLKIQACCCWCLKGAVAMKMVVAVADDNSDETEKRHGYHNPDLPTTENRARGDVAAVES